MRLFLTSLFVALFVAIGCTNQPASEPLAADATATETSTPIPAAEPPETPTPNPTQTPTSTPVPTPTFSPGRVILPTVSLPTSTATKVPEDPLSAKLDEIGVRTGVLRELFSLRTTERNILTREELDEHLKENLDEDRDDIANSEQLYKTLGILESEQDLYDILLNLLGEGVLGFFDPEEEKMYVVRESDELSATDMLTYAHEYIHSLQQQHFDIHSTRENIKENGDQSRAFQALIEGDATLAQTIYLFNNLSESEQQEVIENAQSEVQEVFDSAPYVIQREITFPYSDGFLFTFALFQFGNNDWDILNDAYEAPPTSTEQILHPEKYVIELDEPIEVELFDISQSLDDGWEQAKQNTLGEFFLRTYLETEVTIEEAAIAAEGWGGDTYALLSGPEGMSVVVSKVTWDSEDHAQEFYDTFLNFMTTRTGKEWQAEDGDEMSRHLVTSNQSVLLNINTLDTLLIFAPDVDTLRALQAALQ